MTTIRTAKRRHALPYQVMYEADFVEQRHRGTTFFRWLLAIPLFIWGALWSIAVEVVG